MSAGGPEILTVPGQVAAPAYLPTGNEYVAVPSLRRADAVIEGVNVVHFGLRGLLTFSGGAGPGAGGLIAPLARAGGKALSLAGAALDWRRRWCWLPRFTLAVAGGVISGTVCAPPGEKGFVYVLECARPNGALGAAGAPDVAEFYLGFLVDWAGLGFSVFRARRLPVERHVWRDPWTGAVVLEGRGAAPLAALALACEAEPGRPLTFNREAGPLGAFEAGPLGDTADGGAEPGDVPARLEVGQAFRLAPGETKRIALYVAAGPEADGAATTTVHLRRRGWSSLVEAAGAWLTGRALAAGGDAAGDAPAGCAAGDAARRDAFAARQSLNLFFCLNYAFGRAIDGDELVMVTSRSPAYYVSAAFWARDAFLWAFPALVAADRRLAREALVRGFERHLRHPGEHAQYIDGTVIYPGFELDQAASYLVALETYLDATGDLAALREAAVTRGLDRLEATLAARRDATAGLYRTFLDPCDDPVRLPYLTYDNALAWRGLAVLARARRVLGEPAAARRLAEAAARLRAAIWRCCVVEGPRGPMFAWAVDVGAAGEAAAHELYDAPPGSLELLPYYGFCCRDDPVYRNTVRWIHSRANPHRSGAGRFASPGCRHARGPWPMSACNSILAAAGRAWRPGRAAAPGRPRPRPAAVAAALALLADAPLDGGLMCETVDGHTGEVRTGAQFASAAGLLATSLARAAAAWHPGDGGPQATSGRKGGG